MHHLNIDIPPKSRGLFFAGSVICLFIMIAMCGCISTSGLGGYRETTPPVNYHKTSKNVDLAPSILHPLTFKKGNFSIIVDYNVFFDQYSAYSKTYYDQSAVKNATTEIKNIWEKGNSVQLYDNTDRFKVEDVLFNLIAEGKARIYNEGNAEFVPQVLITNYSMQCGPTCGNGGQKITTEGGLMIFDKRQWVS